MRPPVILFDDPRLTTRATNVVPSDPEDAGMLRTVIQYAEIMPDVIVSAAVFGISKKLIFIRHNGRPIPILNPVMIEARDYSFRNEICWPGLEDFKVRRYRPEYVSITGTALDGSVQNAQVAGENARLLHWHLELMNGVAPIYKMTGFELFQAYRLQYFQERGWPLRLGAEMIAIADRLSRADDAHIKFNGEYSFTVPRMNDLAGQPETFKIDMRNPFSCFSQTDQFFLHILFSRYQNASLSVFQVANPMLVLAANLLTAKDSVISVANDAGHHVVQNFSENTVEYKVPLVKSRLTDLGYRQKPDVLFIDWYWESSDSQEMEADIRKISKKLTAEGVAYLAIPSHLNNLELAKSVFMKVFLRVSSISLNGADILAGIRSTNADADAFKRAEDLIPLPWHSG